MTHFAKYKEKENHAKNKFDMEKAADDIDNQRAEKARKKKEEEKKALQEKLQRDHAEKMFLKDLKDLKMKKSKHGSIAREKAVSI